MRQRLLYGLFGVVLVIAGLSYYSVEAAPYAPDGLTSGQGGGPASPFTSSLVKLFIMYSPPHHYPGNGTPTPINTGTPIPTFVPYTNAEVANKYDYILYHWKRYNLVRDIKTPTPGATPWQGQAQMYFLLNGMHGPGSLASSGTWDDVCGQSERLMRPLGNNIMSSPNDTNEFCNFHDAIASGQAYDHDYDSTTAGVVPTESWFLHAPTTTQGFTRDGVFLEPEIELDEVNGRVEGNYLRAAACSGCRVSESSPDGGTTLQFRPNPDIPQVREMFAGRIRFFMARNEGRFFDGLYLDNLELTTRKLEKNIGATDVLPTEYASSPQAFVDDVATMAAEIRATVQTGLAVSVGQGTPTPTPVPVWANMIEGDGTSNGWDQYDSLLEGGMEEGFALNWNGCPHNNPNIVANQMLQAKNWLADGNHLMAVVQNKRNIACSNGTPISNFTADAHDVLFQERGRFAFGVFLMVADGNASFYLHDSRHTTRLYNDLPEYNLNYGAPQGTYTDGDDPNVTYDDDEVIYKRQFANCTVSVNLSQATANFSACYPNAGTATPTPFIMGRTYNPEGTPVVGTTCLTDDNSISTPGPCVTTGSIGYFLPGSGNQQWGVSAPIPNNQVLVGVTPMSSGGTSTNNGSSAQVVWPTWTTGYRAARFVFATMTPTPTPYIMTRTYNPEGTPVVGTTCLTDDNSISTPGPCVTTSSIGYFLPGSSSQQWGGAVEPTSNEVLLGVTPVPAGGTQTTSGSWTHYVWPTWNTSYRAIRFIIATMTPTPTSTPYIMTRTYNPEGTPVVGTTCLTDDNSISTPGPCVTTSSIGYFLPGSSSQQWGGAVETTGNQVLVGVTPITTGGTQTTSGSWTHYVWPTWNTGYRGVRFIIATQTPIP